MDSTQRVARKRLRARELGVCITCCKRYPPPDRRVCQECGEQALERTRARRARLRDRKRCGRELAEAERAGDDAVVLHYYLEAAQSYRRALEVPQECDDACARIIDKLAFALYRTVDPSTAEPWLKSALEKYARSDERTAHALLQLGRQHWMGSKISAALPLFQKAAEIAKACGNRELQARAILTSVHYLHILGRTEKIEAIIIDARVDPSDDPDLLARFEMAHAMAAASRGERDASFAHFEAALEAAERSETYIATIVWNEYAICSELLGDTERARRAHYQAVETTRKERIAWLVPFHLLNYAEAAWKCGDDRGAADALREALRSELDVPVLRTLLVGIGVPFALAKNDRRLLLRCADESAIDLAFTSGDPQAIAAVASAFAALYHEDGRFADARALLHRALASISCPDYLYELALRIAQFGFETDIAPVREFIVKRTQSPAPELAQAYLEAFDALAELRSGRMLRGRAHARSAVKAFTRIGRVREADMARALAERSDQTVRLTQRERQIAALITRGLTNRAVAEYLGISERTAESHVCSIMKRLGIRSRYQLADALQTKRTQ
ncbi:MAG: helix-turn-helix transcriptional regulator [Candidatus Eremiobacteraeota bacterium]|nr:helix-turn-helix transcriptional regulator [Candidatus Eremiobacteraeota bacterium]